MSQEDGRCPFCHVYLDPSSPICPSCRRNILTHVGGPGGDKIAQRPPSIALTRRNLIIAGIIVVLIAVVPIIAFASFSRGTSNPPSPAPLGKTATIQSTELPTQSVPTPSPTSISTPSPTLASAPVSASCRADWSSGMNGWSGSSEWKVVNGKLLSDGTNTGPGVSVAPSGSDSIMSPCQLSTTNYAVEAKIQILDSPDNCYLAIRGRVQSENSGYSGYFVGFDSHFGDAVIVPFSASVGFTPSKSTIYSPGLNEHTYRAEFKDNQVTLKIDNGVVLQVNDNKFITAGQVGLENGDCQISVSSFQVTTL